MQLSSHLNTNPLFSLINEQSLTNTGSQIVQRSFSSGDTIFAKGDNADFYYIIVDGQVEIRDEQVVLDQLVSGQGLGEMAMLSSQPHRVTAIAQTDTTLMTIPHADFTQLIQTVPDLASQVFAHMQTNLRRIMLTTALTTIMGEAEIDRTTFSEIEDSLVWHTYQPGEVLFSQGDLGEALFIIITGRVRVTRVDEANERVLGELGRGAMVGELALLNNLPRTATSTAIRETTVVKMDAAIFEQLINQSSIFARRLLSVIARRQQQNAEKPSLQQSTPLTFAIVPNQANVDLTSFINQLQPHLEKHGRVAMMDQNQFNTLYRVLDAFEQVPAMMKQQWANELEETHEYVFYIADETWTDWTRWVVSNADRVLFVDHAKNNPQPQDLEQQVVKYAQYQCYELVLLHEPDTIQPAGTAAWLDARQVNRHHHIRQADAAHFARLARLLTGHGIGFVLGGGGARGYAHIGIFKAIMEAQVPIDAIGCVSMGAVVGGAILAALYADDIIPVIVENGKTYGSKKALLDTTIPISAMMRSKKVTAAMHGICGNLNIEDGWLPFFCISTNLTQHRVNVHRRGRLHEAVRASLSIPGIFSPVVRDGDLVVDGGVMNNFPVDVMRDYLEGGTVIGTIVTSTGSYHAYEIEDEVDGVRAFFSRFVPWMKNTRVPSILKTIMAASSVNAYVRQAEYRQQTDVLLETDTAPYGTMDFDNLWELVEKGYEMHHATIQQWASAHPVLQQQQPQWKNFQIQP